MHKNFPFSLLYPLLFLLIPLCGMQFSSEVNWSLFDFIIMGVFLLSLSLGIHLILKKTTRLFKKIILITTISFLFLFLWAELAVGLVGSPFAGN